MGYDEPASYSPEEPSFNVQAEVRAQYDLAEEEEVEDWCKRGMCVFVKLAALVTVAEEVADDG